MNTTEIKKLVKHLDYTTAFIPEERQSIHVPNPFDMQSTIIISHMIAFKEWEEKWLRSGFENIFIIESKSKYNIVIKTTCKIYAGERNKFLSIFKPQ